MSIFEQVLRRADLELKQVRRALKGREEEYKKAAQQLAEAKAALKYGDGTIR